MLHRFTLLRYAVHVAQVRTRGNCAPSTVHCALPHFGTATTTPAAPSDFGTSDFAFCASAFVG
jgi:hypothetical protein